MTPEEKAAYWLEFAQYDLDTADAMLRTSRHLYAVFLCQQALEKVLKAHHAAKGLDPPRSHNLLFLAGGLELALSEEQRSLAARLTAFYIEGRYPSYKQRLAAMTDENTAREAVRATKDLFAWLKRMPPSAKS